jgi:hypothetical protein
MRFVRFTIGLGVGLVLTACRPAGSSPGGQTEASGGAGGTADSGGAAGSADSTVAMGGTSGAAGSTGATGGTSGAAGSTGGAGGTGGASLGPAPAPPPSQNCTDVASASSVLANGRLHVPVWGLAKDYIAQANWWHVYNQQTTTVDGLSFSLANPAGAASSDNSPAGYPSFFIGSYVGYTSKGSNLPKQVSALTNVYTVLSTNASSKGNSNYNVAYDVWFTKTSAPLLTSQGDPGAGGAYLMVWFFKPTDRQPRGSRTHPGQTVSGLPGTWDVWIDPTNPPCVSYVSTTSLEKLDFDLNGFIKDAVSKGYGITNSMYLSVVFGGFEVWGGGDGLQVEAFCANVL